MKSYFSLSGREYKETKLTKKEKKKSQNDWRYERKSLSTHEIGAVIMITVVVQEMNALKTSLFFW